MPLYEYQCSECLQVWEEFDSINAKTVTDCLKCGANKANRMVSQVTEDFGSLDALARADLASEELHAEELRGHSNRRRLVRG